MNPEELEKLMIESGGTYYDNKQGITMSLHDIDRLSKKFKTTINQMINLR